jgi:RecA-family ATPase
MSDAAEALWPGTLPGIAWGAVEEAEEIMVRAPQDLQSRMEAFYGAARAIVPVVRGGFYARREAGDGLLGLAERHGLRAAFGDDAVQAAITDAFGASGAPAAPPATPPEPADHAELEIADEAPLELDEPHSERGTPRSSIEAVMDAVRARGVAALQEPETAARLADCDDEARAEIELRVAKLSGEKPGLGSLPARDEHSAAPLVLRSLAELGDTEPPRRRWLVPGRIPMRAVTILSGDGAAGKTTILMQLCEAVVAGADWLGAVVDEQGPALFLTAEEEDDEIHRRFAAIVRHTGRRFENLPGVQFLSLAGKSAELGVAGRDGIVRPTPLFAQIERSAREMRPRLIAVEAAADVFAGSEIDRGQVRQFIQLLRRLAIEADGAVVLIQHPSVSGMAEGQGRSGSTAWRNRARAQLYFAGRRKTGDDEPEGDVRELRVVKSNYSAHGEVVAVRWQDGVFVPLANPSAAERAAAEADVDALFLRLLDQRETQGRPVTEHPTSRSGAPHIFADLPEANGVSKAAFAAAMERLLKVGSIAVRVEGRKGHERRLLSRPDDAEQVPEGG